MSYIPLHRTPEATRFLPVEIGFVLLVLCVSIAACSSSSKQSATSSPSTSATSGNDVGNSSTVPTASDKAAAAVNVCKTLSTAQVASLSGIALVTSRENDFVEGHAYACDYGTSGNEGVSVTVTTTGGAMAFKNAMENDKLEKVENVTVVNGIGEKAFSANDGLRVLFGDRLIYVTGVGTVPPAKAIALALQAKLS